jgi:hypothetical protein
MAIDAPQVVIRDDGELGAVRALLADMNVCYAEGENAEPTDLLVTSPRYAVRTAQAGTSRCGDRLHIVVVDDSASRTLQKMLERADCDVVARQPVHPTALRLLVQRALFEGEERRRVTRVAIGADVKVKSGFLPRSATLAELSQQGCGLVTSQLLAVGDVVKVILPSSLTGGKALTLEGHVVGVQRTPKGESRGHSVGLAFTHPSRATLKRIQSIMSAHALGITATGLSDQRNAAAAKPRLSAIIDRRRAPRKAYTQSLLARGEQRTHAIIGSDLSTGGMRIDADGDLEIGAKLQLALYGQAGVAPIIVRAVVVRDGGQQGLGLRFEDVSDGARWQLEQLVAALPPLDPETRTGVVVSEVLARD